MAEESKRRAQAAAEAAAKQQAERDSEARKLGMNHQHVLVFYKGRNPNRDVQALQLANATRQLEWT